MIFNHFFLHSMKPHLLLLSLLAAGTVRGAVTLTLGDTTGAPDAVTITPGASFEVILRLTSTAESTSGIGYLLEAFGSASSGFTITARDISGSAFTDLIVADGIALAGSAGFLDPVNDNELGALTAGATNGTGDFKVAAYTIQASPTLAPGTYTIGTRSAVAFDAGFDEIALNQPTYSVTVVPEPSTSLVVASLAAGFALRRRRPVS